MRTSPEHACTVFVFCISDVELRFWKPKGPNSEHKGGAWFNDLRNLHMHGLTGFGSHHTVIVDNHYHCHYEIHHTVNDIDYST